MRRRLPPWCTPQYVDRAPVHALAHDGAVVRQQQNEQHQRRSREALDDSCHYQRLHRIDAQEVQCRAEQREPGDREIEWFRLGRPLSQPIFPAHDLTEVISRAASHHRNSQKSHADHTEGEQDARGVARERAKRLGGVCGGSNIEFARLNSVAAVASMMKYIATFENTIPNSTS